MPLQLSSTPSRCNAFDILQCSPTEGGVGTEMVVDIHLTESAFSAYGSIAIRLVFGIVAVETKVTEFSRSPPGYRLQGRAPPEKPGQRAVGTKQVRVQIVTQDNQLLDEVVCCTFKYLTLGTYSTPNFEFHRSINAQTSHHCVY
jgi:hypothetical protein